MTVECRQPTPRFLLRSRRGALSFVRNPRYHFRVPMNEVRNELSLPMWLVVCINHRSRVTFRPCGRLQSRRFCLLHTYIRSASAHNIIPRSQVFDLNLATHCKPMPHPVHKRQRTTKAKGDSLLLDSSPCLSTLLSQRLGWRRQSIVCPRVFLLIFFCASIPSVTAHWRCCSPASFGTTSLRPRHISGRMFDTSMAPLSPCTHSTSSLPVLTHI